MSFALSKKEVLHNYGGIDKLFYKTMLKDLFSDTCTVKYWDGEEVIYGDRESKLN